MQQKATVHFWWIFITCLSLAAGRPDAVIREGTVVLDPEAYNAFPGICRAANGDILIVYRNAPKRASVTHLDPMSRALLIRSSDGGKTFDTREPVRIFPAEGMQDPSITRLTDGRLLANAFRWDIVPIADQDQPSDRGPPLKDVRNGWMGWVDGIYVSQSSNHGHTWTTPVKLVVPGFLFAATSEPVLELRSSALLLPFYGRRAGRKQFDAGCLMSPDGGKTWPQMFLIASDPEDRISFEEPSLLQVEGGRILCVMRTSGADGYLHVTWSDNFLKSWVPARKTAMWGHPPNLVWLKDGRILCAYGYRRPPFQIRASISSDRGESWDTANEIILRRDGGPDGDIGYPSVLQLEDGSALATYYFQDSLRIRFIGLSHFRISPGGGK